MQYQYEYVTIRTGGGFWINNQECSHRAMIDEHAARGWRYIGYVPTEFTSNGGVKAIDLIFEKQV